MAFYVVARESTAPVQTNVFLALTAATDEIGRVGDIFIGGEATAALVNAYAIRRSTTNGVTPTAQTPAQISSTTPVAQVSGATTFTGTEPVTAAAPAIWTASFNAFGGVIRWAAPPGQELLINGAVPDNEISLEAAIASPSIISCQLVFEEI